MHAVLGHINEPENQKFGQPEDPVEITQPGLQQVQMQPKIGFTFAAAMRAFLRADPDVILIGEMRDHETAAIGIEASLTGHLCFYPRCIQTQLQKTIYSSIGLGA